MPSGVAFDWSGTLGSYTQRRRLKHALPLATSTCYIYIVVHKFMYKVPLRPLNIIMVDIRSTCMCWASYDL